MKQDKPNSMQLTEHTIQEILQKAFDEAVREVKKVDHSFTVKPMSEKVISTHTMGNIIRLSGHSRQHPEGLGVILGHSMMIALADFRGSTIIIPQEKEGGLIYKDDKIAFILFPNWSDEALCWEIVIHVYIQSLGRLE